MRGGVAQPPLRQPHNVVDEIRVDAKCRGERQHGFELGVVDLAIDECHHRGEADGLLCEFGVGGEFARDIGRAQRGRGGRVELEDAARRRRDTGAVGVAGAAAGRCDRQHGGEDGPRLVGGGGNVHGILDAVAMDKAR